MNRPVRIVCTDKGAHNERELAVVVPVSPRADLMAAGAQVEPTEEVRRGWDVRATMTVTTAEGERVIQRVIPKTEAEVVAGTLHVPACPACGRSPRIPEAALEAVASTLPHDEKGRVRLDISLLP